MRFLASQWQLLRLLYRPWKSTAAITPAQKGGHLSRNKQLLSAHTAAYLALLCGYPAMSQQTSLIHEDNDVALQRPGILDTVRLPHTSRSAESITAEVLWDGRTMAIQANNASLQQILQQIAAKTGARLEGALPDGRIFGQYGPGSGCEVIAELLKSSGYNLAMTGSPGTDRPLRIILSARSVTNAQAAVHIATQPQPVIEQASKQDTPGNPNDKLPNSASGQTAQADPNPFANGEQTTDALQFMDDVLHRQEKLDEQQRLQAQQAAGH